MISSTLRSSEEDYGPDFPFFKERSFSWSCARGRRSVPNTPAWEKARQQPGGEVLCPDENRAEGSGTGNAAAAAANGRGKLLREEP